MSLRWTDEQYADFLNRSAPPAPGAPPPPQGEGKPKRRKYGNKKVTVDGETFDSKGEYARWKQLQMMERAGMISDLQRQVVFILAPSVEIDGRMRPPLRFTADFTFREGGELVVEDWKNPATADETAFKIRRHLMKTVHGLDVRITGKRQKSG